MSKSQRAVQHRIEAKKFALAGDVAMCASHLEAAAYYSRSVQDFLNLIKVLKKVRSESLVTLRFGEIIASLIKDARFSDLEDLLLVTWPSMSLNEFCGAISSAILTCIHDSFDANLHHFADRTRFREIWNDAATEIGASALDGVSPPSLLGRSRLNERISDRLVENYYARLGCRLSESMGARKLSKRALKRLAIVTNSLAMGGNERNATESAIAFAKTGGYEAIYFIEGDKQLRGAFFGEAIKAADIVHVNIYEHRRETREPQAYPVDVKRLRIIVGSEEIEILTDIFRAYQIDVVHCFASDQRNAQVAMAAAESQIALVGLNPGSLAPPNRPGSPSSELMRSVRTVYHAACSNDRYLMFFCSLAAAHSYSAWADLPFEACNVNYVGIPTAKPIARRQFWSTEADLLVVGGAFRFHPVKDPMRWIAVALEARSRCPQLRFVIAGDGALLDAARDKVGTSRFADSFLFEGAVEDMNAFYQSIDVLMHTASSEGLCNVLIEAQSHGVPVLARAVGGVPETFVHLRGGFLSETGDVEDLASYLLRFAKDRSLLDTMGAFGRRFVAERFGPDQMLTDMTRAYEARLKSTSTLKFKVGLQ